MFTGLVEEIGTVASWHHTNQGQHITIQASASFLNGSQLGDSIAVNGACLTVTELTNNAFTVGVSIETKERTNLLELKRNDSVHLERALTPTSRMGGHFVQGHIDGVGTLINREQKGESLWLTITTEPSLLRYIVPKGFIALDGTSLTIVNVSDSYFTVMLVPYTQNFILLPQKKVGSYINIEVDILGKYVEKMLGLKEESSVSTLSEQFLRDHGY